MNRLCESLATVVRGQDEAIRRLAVGFLAGGHVLLEGVPGVGKTLLARAFARTVGLDFRRIQCTPDLMPADVTGTHVLDPRTTAFVFRPGPLFAHVVLVDEVNRAVPKTQSAFLEAMEEGRVTAEGESFELPRPFFVLATQNPVEFEGTFPLPEAQRDRFLLRVRVGYPDEAAEREVVARGAARTEGDLAETISCVLDAAGARSARASAAAVRAEDPVVAYAVALARATRDDPAIALGASPRAAQALLRAAKGEAALSGMDFATPDEVKSVAAAVLAHRIVLRPEAEVEGADAEAVIERLLDRVPVPR